MLQLDPLSLFSVSVRSSSFSPVTEPLSSVSFLSVFIVRMHVCEAHDLAECLAAPHPNLGHSYQCTQSQGLFTLARSLRLRALRCNAPMVTLLLSE